MYLLWVILVYTKHEAKDKIFSKFDVFIIIFGFSSVSCSKASKKKEGSDKDCIMCQKIVQNRKFHAYRLKINKILLVFLQCRKRLHRYRDTAVKKTFLLNVI